MKIFKSLTLIFICTFVALVYVHQQIELVKLSYAIDSKEKKLKEMLDYRDSISYTIENLESPSRLEKVLLAKNIDIMFPKAAQVIMTKRLAVSGIKEERLRTAGIEKRFDIFGILEFFNPRAEAQATEK